MLVFRKFSTIFSVQPQTSVIFANFPRPRKNSLTNVAFARILARGRVGFALWRRKTCVFWNNLHHTRKNFLTFLAFALILAQATLIFASLLYYWRPRAKIPDFSGFFDGLEPAFLKGCRAGAPACSTWNLSAKCVREFFAVIVSKACAPFCAKPRKDFVERKIALG